MRNDLFITHPGAINPETLLLNEEGIAFSKSLKALFKEIPIGHICTSKQLCCIETAWLVAAEKKVGINTFEHMYFRRLLPMAWHTAMRSTPKESACLMILNPEDMEFLIKAIAKAETPAIGTLIKLDRDYISSYITPE